jgi:hypothetical protein
LAAFFAGGQGEFTRKGNIAWQLYRNFGKMLPEGLHLHGCGDRVINKAVFRLVTIFGRFCEK